MHAARSAPGQIATLILPADTAWSEGAVPAAPLPPQGRTAVLPETLDLVARVLRSREPALLLLAGQALTEAGLQAAQRVAVRSGAVVRTATQVGRMARGRGRAPIDRLPYPVDAAVKVLSGFRHVILVGAKPPTGFFGYPGKPSSLAPPDASVHVLARPEQDAVGALEWLAETLGAPKDVTTAPAGPEPELVRGAFSPEAFAKVMGVLLPDHCIVAEDGVTSGRALFPATMDAPPHDWLQVTGGAIGHAFPCATGAAIACPDRKVVCFQADGAGMYSLQALWTQARERLDVVNVVFANGQYRILHGELAAVGAQAGRASNDLFDLTRPTLDWVKLSEGMGVEAARVETLEAFADVFQAAVRQRGPRLIEFRID